MLHKDTEKDISMKEVGSTIKQAPKYGGSYVIIGHINCPRQSCNRVIEEREQQEPSKKHKKVGYYWSQWTLCPHCGLYNGERKIFI